MLMIIYSNYIFHYIYVYSVKEYMFQQKNLDIKGNVIIIYW